MSKPGGFHEVHNPIVDSALVPKTPVNEETLKRLRSGGEFSSQVGSSARNGNNDGSAGGRAAAAAARGNNDLDDDNVSVAVSVVHSIGDGVAVKRPSGNAVFVNNKETQRTREINHEHAKSSGHKATLRRQASADRLSSLAGDIFPTGTPRGSGHIKCSIDGQVLSQSDTARNRRQIELRHSEHTEFCPAPREVSGPNKPLALAQTKFRNLWRPSSTHTHEWEEGAERGTWGADSDMMKRLDAEEKLLQDGKSPEAKRLAERRKRAGVRAEHAPAGAACVETRLATSITSPRNQNQKAGSKKGATGREGFFESPKKKDSSASADSRETTQIPSHAVQLGRDGPLVRSGNRASSAAADDKSSVAGSVAESSVRSGRTGRSDVGSSTYVRSNRNHGQNGAASSAVGGARAAGNTSTRRPQLTSEQMKMVIGRSKPHNPQHPHNHQKPHKAGHFHKTFDFRQGSSAAGGPRAAIHARSPTETSSWVSVGSVVSGHGPSHHPSHHRFEGIRRAASNVFHA